MSEDETLLFEKRKEKMKRKEERIQKFLKDDYFSVKLKQSISPEEKEKLEELEELPEEEAWEE